MWFIVCFFLAGIPLGYAVRKFPWAVRGTDIISIWAVRLLLFSLGLTLGTNDSLYAQLDTLGVQALVIAVAAVLGSLVGVRLLAPFLHIEPAMPQRTVSTPQHSTVTHNSSGTGTA